MMKFLCLFLFLSVVSSAQAADIPKTVQFEQLSFLEGCWKGTIGGKVVYESWGNQEGNLMLGASKTISEEKIDSFEFLSIVILEGRLHYKPYVNGTNRVTFPLLEAGPSTVEFSNPEHDFPKSIKYERKGSRLDITLAGEEGQSEDYSLNWTSCSE